MAKRLASKVNHSLLLKFGISGAICLLPLYGSAHRVARTFTPESFVSRSTVSHTTVISPNVYSSCPLLFTGGLDLTCSSIHEHPELSPAACSQPREALNSAQRRPKTWYFPRDTECGVRLCWLWYRMPLVVTAHHLLQHSTERVYVSCRIFTINSDCFCKQHCNRLLFVSETDRVL